MEPKLITIRVLMAVLSVVTLIIAVTSVYPALTGDIEIDIPEEDELQWDFVEDDIVVEGDMWVNNSGFYDLKDIEISIDVSGFNKTFFVQERKVEEVKSGESRRIHLTLKKNFDDFSEEEKRELVFNETDFHINSDMTANYPFWILGFELDYDSPVDWQGIVKELEYQKDDISLSQEGEKDAKVEVPFHVLTSDVLTGESNVSLSMKNASTEDVFAEDKVQVPLGESFDSTIEFMLNESETRSFVLKNKSLLLSSQIDISGLSRTVNYNKSYGWEALVKDITFKYEESEVRKKESAEGSDLILPYRVSTSDRLEGDSSVNIVMYNRSTGEEFSTDDEDIPLGKNHEGSLRFPLNDTESGEFITTSQKVHFNSDVLLEERGIEFDYNSSHDWGAPLDGLNIYDFNYDSTGQEGSVKINFTNDSPKELQMIVEVNVYDSSGNLIGQDSTSYMEDDDYRVSSNSEFTDKINVSVYAEPYRAEIDFIDGNTGMELEKVIYR